MSSIEGVLSDRATYSRPVLQPLRVHRAQFLIGPRFVALEPDWTEYRLGNNLSLSADPALHIQELRSADSVRHLLLGHALLSDSNARLEDAVSEIQSEDIIDWSSNWSGRWVLITPDHCVPDASSSLGVFYRRLGETVWLSGSVAILATCIPGEPIPNRIPWDVVHEQVMDWVPVPLSTRAGILKLLPFRKIALRDGHLSLTQMPSIRSSSVNAIDEMASRLVNLARNTEHFDFGRRRLDLTAGLDTRTILSAFAAAHMPFETTTSVSPWSSAADKSLPPRLATIVGAPHTFSYRAEVDESVVSERYRIIDKHTDGQTAATCVAYAAYAVETSSNIVQFGGLGFELARSHFWHRLSSPDKINQFFDDPVHERWYAALSQWVSSLDEPIPLMIDWRDRFYLEQRLGGWSSSNHQCSDIVPSVRIHLGNCARLFQLLLLQPEAERKSGSAQLAIIKRLAPELAKLPINPRSASETLKRRSRQISRKAIRAIRSVFPRAAA